MVRASHPKSFAKIKLTTNWVINQKLPGTLTFDSSVKNKISAVHNLQSLTNVVIGDQNRQARLPEVSNMLLNFRDGDRIDPAKRLVEHHQLRIGDQRPRDGQSAFFAAAECESLIFGKILDSKLSE